MSAAAQAKDNVKKSHAVGHAPKADAGYREFITATRGVSFVRDPLEAATAIAHDPLAPNVQRVLQWIKLCSWGKLRLYCVLDNGELAFGADCARELKMPRSTAYRCIEYLEARGYIQRHGASKKLYPVINPTIATLPARAADETEFQKFVDTWKVANSSAAHELEVARATADRIRQTMWNEYRARLQAERRNSAQPKPAAVTPLAAPASEVAPEILTAFESAVPFSAKTAAELVKQVRAKAAAQGESLSDGEIISAIRAAAAAAGHHVRNFGFFKTALPEKIEALLEARRRDEEHAAELAGKCPRCKGTGRHPSFPQDVCPDCGGRLS